TPASPLFRESEGDAGVAATDSYRSIPGSARNMRTRRIDPCQPGTPWLPAARPDRAGQWRRNSVDPASTRWPRQIFRCAAENPALAPAANRCPMGPPVAEAGADREL